EFAEAGNQIQTVLEQNDNWMSDQQKAVITQLCDAVDNERKRRVQEASQWLETIEQRLNNANDVEQLLTLRQSIQRRPTFLSDEGVSKLGSVENSIQERIAQDAESQV